MGPLPQSCSLRSPSSRISFFLERKVEVACLQLTIGPLRPGIARAGLRPAGIDDGLRPDLGSLATLAAEARLPACYACVLDTTVSTTGYAREFVRSLRSLQKPGYRRATHAPRIRCIKYWLRQGLGSLASLATDARIPRQRKRCGNWRYTESSTGYAREFVRSLRSLQKPGYPGTASLCTTDIP